MTEYDAVDDFAGPGGWEVGARMIGLTTIGNEWDAAACQTATAAGFARIQEDISTQSCEQFKGIPGYISSPPCTLFSLAGKGTGRLAIALLTNAIVRMFAGEDVREEVREAIYNEITLPARADENARRDQSKKWSAEKVGKAARSDAFIATLVLEPVRRIIGLDPEWITLEQVTAVLPLWRVIAHELRNRGYSVWTGVLNAADYGVPQARERAILIASLVRTVGKPEPTHSREGSDGGLFGLVLKKWVTMADALGWGFDEPSCTVSSGGAATGGAEPFANANYRRRLAAWVFARPATTVVGSFKPEGSVTVTVAEAGILQSFPADYSWQGSKGKQYEQVGNAVPPLLAAHILAEATGREVAA